MRTIYIVVGVFLVLLMAAGCGFQPAPYVPTPIPTLIPATLPAEAIGAAETPSQTESGPTPATPSEPAQTGGGDAAAGEAIFNANCSACHNLTHEKKVGPGLEGIFDHPQLPNGKPVTGENLREWIQNGGGAMPGIPLSAGELDDLIAFLKTR